MDLTNTDALWRAWEAKDASMDGKFFVAVKTTKIYCRPSCSARPLRKNVQFFATADACEATGFRACKRCHPRATHVPDAAAELAHKATAYIESNGHARLEPMATALHVSPYHLQRSFKQVLGVTPMRYAQQLRAGKLRTQLGQGSSVTEAVYAAGYETSSTVYTEHALGMPPGAWQNGGAAQTIRYTHAACALGRMLLAGTQHGVCALYFGDDDAALARNLREEYPNATLQAQQNQPEMEHRAEPGVPFREKSSDAQLRTWVRTVQAAIDGADAHRALPGLPLDVQGTAFQARVWQALRGIPRGETRSYQQVAQTIGQPAAFRAVANACAANRVALVIPCHRVVRGNGSPGGYRWGEARKLRLLEQEQR